MPIRWTDHSCWHSGHRLFCLTHNFMQQLWNEWLQSPVTKPNVSVLCMNMFLGKRVSSKQEAPHFAHPGFRQSESVKQVPPPSSQGCAGLHALSQQSSSGSQRPLFTSTLLAKFSPVKQLFVPQISVPGQSSSVLQSPSPTVQFVSLLQQCSPPRQCIGI